MRKDLPFVNRVPPFKLQKYVSNYTNLFQSMDEFHILHLFAHGSMT